MKVKKMLNGLLFAGVLAIGTGSAAEAQELELLEPGVLKCAFSGSYAPFAMQDASGDWSGLGDRGVPRKRSHAWISSWST